MDWHYANEGTQVGPIGEDEFLDLVTKGVIHAQTLIWCPGMTDWQPYGRVIEGTAGWESCGHCGTSRVEEEMIRFDGRYICQDCKPVFIQYIKEGRRMPWIMEFAGFWGRALAKVIDIFVLYVLFIAIIMSVFSMVGFASALDNPGSMIAIQIVIQIITFGIPIAYTVFFLGKFGATPGKMTLGMKVVTADGGRVTYLRALGRHFAEMLSSLTMLIGYIVAAFDKQKRTLHDHICTTRVVMK